MDKGHMKKMYEVGKRLMAEGKMLIEMSGESDMEQAEAKRSEPEPEMEDERGGRNKMLAASLKRKGY